MEKVGIFKTPEAKIRKKFPLPKAFPNRSQESQKKKSIIRKIFRLLGNDSQSEFLQISEQQGAPSYGNNMKNVVILAVVTLLQST